MEMYEFPELRGHLSIYNEKLKTRIGLKLHTKIAQNYKKAK